MKIVSGFFVYRVYITYKAHFSSSKFDINTYNYNLFNPSYSTFLTTKGIHYYDYLAKKIRTEKNVVSLFIAAFMDDPNVWIGDIYTDLEHYLDLKEIRESRIDNMSYIFKQNCVYLLEQGMRFNDKMGTFVLYRFLESNIEVETFIILKKIFIFNLDNNTNYDYLYRGKYEKYEFLLRIDTEKYKKILKEIVMTFRD